MFGMKRFKAGDRVKYDGQDECVMVNSAGTGTVLGYHPDGSVMVLLDVPGVRQDIDPANLTKI